MRSGFKKSKINYKIREHSLAKVPLILVCGKKKFQIIRLQ